MTHRAPPYPTHQSACGYTSSTNHTNGNKSHHGYFFFFFLWELTQIRVTLEKLVTKLTARTVVSHFKLGTGGNHVHMYRFGQASSKHMLAMPCCQNRCQNVTISATFYHLKFFCLPTTNSRWCSQFSLSNSSPFVSTGTLWRRFSKEKDLLCPTQTHFKKASLLFDRTLPVAGFYFLSPNASGSVLG